MNQKKACCLAAFCLPVHFFFYCLGFVFTMKVLFQRRFCVPPTRFGKHRPLSVCFISLFWLLALLLLSCAVFGVHDPMRAVRIP